jgi:Domain of unknown function (DUF5753)
MDEAVLRREVGGPEVMARQLDKIVQTAREGYVKLQVIPFNSGSMATSDSNFTLFELGAALLR